MSAPQPDMDEKAEAFRVMTMQVLQIQLRSLTAMDAVGLRRHRGRHRRGGLACSSSAAWTWRGR